MQRVRLGIAVCLALIGAVLIPATASASVYVDSTPDPAWGVDGTVYAVKIVGDTAFVGGSFSNAVNSVGQTVPRKNLAAFSMSTGNVLPWQVDAGGVVRALASDGTSLFVGGSFTKVGGVTSPYLASVDIASATTNAAFKPNLNNNVRVVRSSGSSLYVGGAFTTAGGVSRTSLAKIDKTTGALDTAFNDVINGPVWGLTVSPTNPVVYFAGKFTTVNGTTRTGVTGVNATTGAVTGPAFNSSARPTYGLDMNDDGTMLYGAGGTGANTAAAWNVSSGVRVWRVVTDGDIQAIDYHRGTVYFGFHDGYQGDGHINFLAADAATGVVDPNFRPQFNNFWGVWAVDVSDDGVVIGGDFTKISGVPTKGYALFSRTGNLPTPPVTTQWIGSATAWSYWDQGGRPAGWEQPGFNDSAWPKGTPQLGYGDNDESTVIYRGPTGAPYVTSYFRTTINVDKVPDTVDLDLLADDGAVVYVNGVEAVRDNMPTGTITASTFASTDRTGGPENAFRPFTFAPSMLHTGTNTIAVEVHQRSNTSSDLSFDLNLSGEAAGTPLVPPTAEFTAVPDTNLNVAFDGSSTTDDGTVVDYAWNFGDGTTAHGASPTINHPYATAGDYTVVLRVTDDTGATDSVVHTVTAKSSTTTSVVVPRKASWQWRYVATAPPAGWNGTAFDDSTWTSGGAPLGWGSSSIVTNIDTFATTTDRPKAAYFRKSFTVPDASKAVSLTLNTVADDGVVVYVNGVEVGRLNMPTGTPTINTGASSAPRTTAANSSPLVITVPVGLLQTGTNVVAAETHVNYKGTPDLSFDLDGTLVSGS